MRLRTHSEAQPTAPPSLVVCSGLAIAAVVALLSMRAVTPAVGVHLVPRWDLAAHLLNGWTSYDHLAHGRLLSFSWDLWNQGYWPPGQSLFQIPFFAAFSGSIAGGQYSSAIAFALTLAGAVVLLGRLLGREAWLPAALAVALMSTSPFFLAYATVAMSEMVGALAQMAVLLCYAQYDRTPSVAATRWLAGALTVLFFTKYNYFILLAVPLGAHVFLRETAGWSAGARLSVLATWLASAPRFATAAYIAVVTAVLFSGGISFPVGAHRVAFRTVGYSMHVPLYCWLVWAWHTHRRGQWDVARLAERDHRLPSLLAWFVAPVTMWLASPFPNHVKDMVYLVVNVPMGPSSTQLGLAAYLSAVRSDYFPHPAVFAVSITAFLIAILRHRRQPTLIRLLIAIAALQAAMVTAHHTRDARFLLLAMPPFWLVVAHEVGGWLPRRWPAARRVVGVAVLAGAVVGAHTVTASAAFRYRALEHFVPSAGLADALTTIRETIPPDIDVAVIGRRDDVSPSLVKWQLGPPAGRRHFPREVLRVGDLPAIDTAGVVILIEPSAALVARASRRVTALVAAGTLVPSQVFALADRDVTIRVFLRAPA